MKLSRVLSALILLGTMFCEPTFASEPPELSAEAWVLTDADTGRVLAGKNADEPRLIASTTKIMTALIALEYCDPDAEVRIEPEWTGIEGSTMYLEPDQELTIRQLLYGLLLASGNDAAEALACLTAGDIESFAALMNERAEKLGCENTHFENPSGLDGQSHYASARDLSLIAREAMANEEFRRIVSTSSAAVGDRVYTNHNRLLRECEGVIGVKTGYTEAAGRTLVSCCEREGVTLICVTLDDPDDWADHSAVYDWAFAEYETEDLLADRSWTIPVVGGAAESVVVTGAELSVAHLPGEKLRLEAELPSFAFAPVAAGGRAGRAVACVDGERIAEAPLYYARSVMPESGERPGLPAWLRILLGFTERKAYAFI